MCAKFERFRYYLGTAQIKVLNLCYSAPTTDLDDCEGCCISNLQHNLPALIGLSDYQDCLTRANITTDTLYAVRLSPKLTLPKDVELPCLHGRFRLEAVKQEGSQSQDNWWLVDLYTSVSTDTPSTTLTQIRQFYRRHATSCDGEKFLHIRFYKREKNYAAASKWERLLGTKTKSMKQVLRNEWLRDCLEKLEPFRSLWMGFQLGSFPLILSWRCAQEIECYLEKMYRIWYTITGGETYLCDEYTVEKLGGLAPLWSAHDRSLIESLFAAGHIFPRVRDPAVRARISQKVLTVEGFVLTFQTFFKQVKILGPIMHPLRELFPASDFYPSRGEFSLDSRRLPSVRDILLQRWRERPEPNKQQYVLQYNEIDDRSVECSDPGLYSYWQLCLYLLRHSQGHQGFPKTQYRAEPSERPGWVVRLGQFARRLGFESEQISLLCNQDPNLSQIRIHLLEERPSTFFSAPADKFDAEAHSRQRGQAIFDYRPPTVTPLMTTDSATVMRVPRTHPELFLPTIWSALTQQPRYALTEYGALVLICLSFFEGFGSNSVANVGEGPQPVPSLLRSSSVYSVPAYPDSHRASITFWHLPQRRDMSPLAEYICDTTIKDIEKVVNNIRAQGQAPLFALVDSDGRLRLCDPSQILYRRKRSKQPKDVYYIYREENCKIWIIKKLNSYRK
ncbi:hypothetical protein J3E71DRAFT_171788 [Bipolaris maydis]|nr:hypothetical protein J3E71DRAFT_171788 [Bipolaris maydis]